MDALPLQHGQDWAGEDLTGWYMAEKFDGCRAYWDGANLWTRGGHPVRLPAHWRLPAMALDCELYDSGAGTASARRARCAVALRYGRFTDTQHLMVFDAPHIDSDWPERMLIARAALLGNPHVIAMHWRVCHSNSDAANVLLEVQAHGGEGLMLRRPGERYTPGRSHGLLKLKHDPLIAAMELAA